MTINHRSIRLAPFVCALLMARLCPLSAQEVFHSQHNYQIVVDRGAGPLERFAAEELKMILNKSFSMPLSVDGKTDGVIFYVGQSEASVQAGFTQVKFKDDEFGVFYRPGSFLLCGFNDTTNAFSVYGRTGTLSAVYYFAEKYLGTRFFYPGEEGVVIARDPVVKPPPAAEKVTPFFSTRSFIFRGLGYGSGLSSKDVPVRDLILFSRRLLCSRPLWQNCVPYEFSNWKDRFAQSNLLLLARNGNEPVFADCGGKKHYSPCVTSDEAAAQAADDIIRLFATRTDVPSVHYYDDIWYVPCECERCQVSPLRILGKAGGDVFDPTEEYYDFLKRVGNIVFSAYPDRRLMAHTKGNRYGKSPPSQTTLDRRIVLSLYVQRQWLCDPEVANSIPGFVRRWQVATGGPVLVHSYTRYPTFFDYPLITPRHFAAYLRSLKGLIQGEFCGDIDPATPYAFSALNAWVQAKLLFDPDRDVDALINEFCALAYPGAEVEMSQFYTEMENAWAATGTQGFKVDPLKIIYNKKNLGKALRWLEVARGRVKSPASFYEKIHTAFYEFYEKAGDPALPEEAEKLERPKFITVPALSAKTVIDGAIAEREWQGSSSFSFASMEMQKRPNDFQTTQLYMKSDSQALYLAVRAMESNVSNLVRTCDKSGPHPIWNDDSLEFMFIPGKEDFPYYQILVNAAGTCRVLLYKAEGKYEDVADFEFDCVSKLYHDRYEVELRLPLSSLSGLDGRQMRFNCFRNRKAGAAQSSGLTYAAGGYRNLQIYNFINIEDF